METKRLRERSIENCEKDLSGWGKWIKVLEPRPYLGWWERMVSKKSFAKPNAEAFGDDSLRIFVMVIIFVLSLISFCALGFQCLLVMQLWKRKVKPEL